VKWERKGKGMLIKCKVMGKEMWIRCEVLKEKERKIAVINNPKFAQVL
jgi:hypothetical protein